MLKLAPALVAAAVLTMTATAQAAPPPDKLPGTIHFDSGSTTVKAKPGKQKKHVRRAGNAVLNKNAARDGTSKQ